MGRKLQDRNAAAETIAAQALGRIEPQFGGVVPPIHIATTYERDSDNAYSRGLTYARPHNPTTRLAEEVIAALEEGADAALYASGMAAATALFAALPASSHVVAPKVMYWALRAWLSEQHKDGRLEVSFVDTTDLEALAAAVRPQITRLVWIETPANPLWSITDIAAAAEVAHRAGALLGVDSTAATPVLTKPLRLGADVVMHSASKYLNGHSDVLAGVLVTAREDGLWERILRRRGQEGPVLGPFEAALLLRGMRTLYVRVRAANANALAIAEHISGHEALRAVLYPGLADFPGHDVAERQMSGGFGAMVSIRLSGGEAAAIATAARLEVWKRATSLGGVESLVEHRASIEGKGSPVPADLLRLSAGIEEVGDLIADLEQALAAL
jgi:cystathionine gamma-synthase